MAISPQEAMKKAKPKQEDIKKLEARIDAALIKAFKDNDSTDTYIFETFPNKATENEIIRIYKLAGWSVQPRSDSRDGEYLSFKKRKEVERDYFPYNH